MLSSKSIDGIAISSKYLNSRIRLSADGRFLEHCHFVDSLSDAWVAQGLVACSTPLVFQASGSGDLVI